MKAGFAFPLMTTPMDSENPSEGEPRSIDEGEDSAREIMAQRLARGLPYINPFTGEYFPGRSANEAPPPPENS